MNIELFGQSLIPIILALCAAQILFSKKDLFSEMCGGIKSGFSLTKEIFPNLVLLLCAVKMVNASGLLSLPEMLFNPLFKMLGLSDKMLSVLCIRPLSGSAANAVLNELFLAVSPDSFTGFCASVFMGCTDTVFYTFSVYFGAGNVTKIRYGFAAAFFVFLFCFFCSVQLSRLFYY